MSTFKTTIAITLFLLSCALGATEQVNLNSANAATLAETIIGIGPAKAAAIVEFREQHGPFKTIDDLLLVKGIGEATLSKNRDRLTAASP